MGRSEGAAIRVDGYLAGARLERDAIVVEITPRVRALHPRWTLDRIAAIVRDQREVRVSGWLMLDQMHPELVGVNRATMWEVHRIMHLEVLEPGGAWVDLDDLAH